MIDTHDLSIPRVSPVKEKYRYILLEAHNTYELLKSIIRKTLRKIFYYSFGQISSIHTNKPQTFKLFHPEVAIQK